MNQVVIALSSFLLIVLWIRIALSLSKLSVMA